MELLLSQAKKPHVSAGKSYHQQLLQDLAYCVLSLWRFSSDEAREPFIAA